jgi:hypothetical protein
MEKEVRDAVLSQIIHCSKTFNCSKTWTAQPVRINPGSMGGDQSKEEIETSSRKGVKDTQHDSTPDVVNNWIWKYAKIQVL